MLRVRDSHADSHPIPRTSGTVNSRLENPPPPDTSCPTSNPTPIPRPSGHFPAGSSRIKTHYHRLFSTGGGVAVSCVRRCERLKHGGLSCRKIARSLGVGSAQPALQPFLPPTACWRFLSMPDWAPSFSHRPAHEQRPMPDWARCHTDSAPGVRLLWQGLRPGARRAPVQLVSAEPTGRGLALDGWRRSPRRRNWIRRLPPGKRCR